jgi:glucose/sorbosone dehydrogenase
MRRAVLLLSTAIAFLAFAPSAGAAVSLQSVGTFSSPIYVTYAPGDTSRLFVVERGGTVRIVQSGSTLATPFLSLPGLSQAGEGGLLSIAFPPDYATSGRLYAYYTPSASTIRIGEFVRNPSDPNQVIGGPRTVIDIPHPTFTNHYGGQLQFDRAGRLYIGPGDGGTGGDPPGNAQNRGRLLGKILRLNPRQSGTAPYTIPADNPFVHQAGRRPEIWSYGLRNPFRFSFDRTTGDLTIGDVGQSNREEIDFVSRPAGAGHGVNFGWNVCEGKQSYPDTGNPCGLGASNYVGPALDYPTSSTPCGSVTGGVVVRDASMNDSALAGKYIYADYCTGAVRTTTLPSASDDAPFMSIAQFNPVAFGEDACGRVYLAQLSSGDVSRLEDGSSSCSSALALPPAPPSFPVNLPASGGSSGPPAVQGPVLDLRSPLLGLRTGSRQHPLGRRGVVVRIRCDEPCGVRAFGRLDLRRRGRRIRVGEKELSLGANHSVRLILPISRGSRSTLRRALRRGRRVRARVIVRVRDGARNLSVGDRLVRLLP